MHLYHPESHRSSLKSIATILTSLSNEEDVKTNCKCWILIADRGVHLLLVTSTIFQVCLYLFKKLRWQIHSKTVPCRQISPPNLRLRNERENYVGQLQKSIVDNVSNIYRILFVIAVSAVSTAFGLYHMWRLRKNSEKSSEKLNSTILPPGIFLLLAVFSFCALMPYFTSQALRWIHLVMS